MVLSASYAHQANPIKLTVDDGRIKRCYHFRPGLGYDDLSMMNELDGNQDWLTFDRTLHEVLMAIGVPADEHQRKLMFIHYHRMVAANQRFNLTRITSVADDAIKHYADS